MIARHSRSIPRSTAREDWNLSIEYFDGRCEALTHCAAVVYGEDPRCFNKATEERDGYASCWQHARPNVAVHQWFPEAAEFRFAKLVPQRRLKLYEPDF